MGRKFDLIFAASAIGACVVIAIGFAAPAFAGGVDFGPDESNDAGPPYLGVATDQTGVAVPDVKVTVAVARLNSTLVQRSDSQGHFFIQGFDKSVKPDDVAVTCSKDGYQDAQGAKTLGQNSTAPIQVLCTLVKKP